MSNVQNKRVLQLGHHFCKHNIASNSHVAKRLKFRLFFGYSNFVYLVWGGIQRPLDTPLGLFNGTLTHGKANISNNGCSHTTYMLTIASYQLHDVSLN